MTERRYPAVVIDHGKVQHNVKTVCDWCQEEGIFVAGVIKGANGMVSVAEDYVAGGAKMIASSRLEQLKRCKEKNLGVPLMMIRVPMMSELSELVQIADYSLNSEIATLRALDKAAADQGKIHNVVLMADLGDLREGFFDSEELVATAKEVEDTLPHLHLAGVGTNLGCYGSVMATEDKMQDLAEIAEAVEKEIGRPLEIVSGGATSSLMGVFGKYMPKKINMLRIGAAILTGPLEDMCTCYGYSEMNALSDEAFTLEAQVIEVKKKASHPIGQLGVDAFGQKPEYVDRGIRTRALVAIGRADYGDIGDLVPTILGMEVIGASGDHTILDIEDVKEPIKVGDIITFKLKYSAILRVTGSENVKRFERSK
ncbi:MAG: alanine racemase [Eubacteriales bacterium]|nr:alanine racemase [Eubacteriales bacterium]